MDLDYIREQVPAMCDLVAKLDAENAELRRRVLAALKAWDDAPTGSMADLVSRVSPAMGKLREWVKP